MVAMSGHAVVPDLDAHPGVLEGIRAEMATLGISHVTIQLEVARTGARGATTPGPPLPPHARGGAAHAGHGHPGHRH